MDDIKPRVASEVARDQCEACGHERGWHNPCSRCAADQRSCLSFKGPPAVIKGGYEDHVVFEKPDNDQAAIWRYMDLAKFLDLISTTSLNFPRADRLGDPFEGSYPGFNVKARAAVYAARGASGEGLDRLLSQLGAISRALPRFTYVNCWTLADHESAALWNIYTGKQGLAVRSTYRRLIDALRETEHRIHVGRVRYIDYRTEWLPEGNTLYPFVHKRNSFQFETELRAVIQDLSGTEDPAWPDKPGRPGLKVPIDLATLVERVHVSPAAPDWLLDLVRRVCEKFDLKVEVMKSEMAGDPVY